MAARLDAAELRPYLKGMLEAVVPCMDFKMAVHPECSGSLASEAIEAAGFLLVAAVEILQPQEGHAVVQRVLPCLFDDRHGSAIKFCHTLCEGLGEEALQLLDLTAVLPVILRYATLPDGSELATLKGGQGVHTGELEARLAALEALAALTVGGEAAFGSCSAALLATIASPQGPHPNSEVRIAACVGLQPWWQWYEDGLLHGRVARDPSFAGAVVGAIEALMGLHVEDPTGALEAVCLARMVLESECMKAEPGTVARLNAACDKYYIEVDEEGQEEDD